MKKSLQLALIIMCFTVQGVVPQERKNSTMDPVKLLESATGHTTHCYKGRLMITEWYGTRTKAQEANIYFQPPGLYRLEFLALDGEIDRVVLGDGKREQIMIVKGEKTVSSTIAKVSPRFISRDQEQHLILSNYKVTFNGSDHVMGRPVWVVQLSPLTPGKPLQTIMIDQSTKTILETKRYLSDKKFGALTRFTRFESPDQLPPGLFLEKEKSLNTETAESESPLASMEKLKHVSGEPFNVPMTLAGGFSLESVDIFEVKGEPVRHLRYTDGLVPLSLFLTNLPVKMPESFVEGKTMTLDKTLLFGSTSSGPVAHWNSGRKYFTLIGDVSNDLVSRITPEIN